MAPPSGLMTSLSGEPLGNSVLTDSTSPVYSAFCTTRSRHSSGTDWTASGFLLELVALSRASFLSRYPLTKGSFSFLWCLCLSRRSRSCSKERRAVAVKAKLWWDMLTTRCYRCPAFLFCFQSQPAAGSAELFWYLISHGPCCLWAGAYFYHSHMAGACQV